MEVRLFSKVKPGTAFVNEALGVAREQPIRKSQEEDAENAAYDSKVRHERTACLQQQPAQAMLSLSLIILQNEAQMQADVRCCTDLCVSQQVLQQAGQVAVDATYLVQQASKSKQASQQTIADIWTDGSLADTEDGLPNRQTRIYIPESMACRKQTSRPKHSHEPVMPLDNSSNDSAGIPAKKKRKGKAERNRLKRGAEALAAQPQADVSVAA